MLRHTTRHSRTSRGAALPVALVLLVSLSACGQGTGDVPADLGPSGASLPSSPSPSQSSPSSSPSSSDPAPEDVAQAGTTTLTEPASGAQVPGPSVHVAGSATAFEGTLVWDVRSAADPRAEPVAQGSTQAGANGEVGPFAFDVELDPGTWVLRVWEPDMSDGGAEQGRGTMVRSTFTVG